MRRHGEPNRFLFLPKMGLLGSQAGNEKKSIMNYELLLRAVVWCFHGKKFNLFLLHCSVRTKKLHKIKVRKYFLWIKNCVFLELAVLVFLVIIVKGVSPLLLPLVSLDWVDKYLANYIYPVALVNTVIGNGNGAIIPRFQKPRESWKIKSEQLFYLAKLFIIIFLTVLNPIIFVQFELKLF